MLGHFDFVIASEVLEDVEAPIERALRNMYMLLKPNGFALITVPWWFQPETIEYYPNLHSYTVTESAGQWTLVNKTRDGVLEVFENPFFSRGAGSPRLRCDCSPVLIYRSVYRKQVLLQFISVILLLSSMG
jgi:hypothetical protein